MPGQLMIAVLKGSDRNTCPWLSGALKTETFALLTASSGWTVAGKTHVSRFDNSKEAKVFWQLHTNSC